MIQRMCGQVEDRATHAVLRTPSVPDFWYGNCLAMPGPPREGDCERWMRLFAEAFPDKQHRVFLIDAPEGAIGAAQAFLDQGFTVTCLDVLAMRELLRPPGLSAAFAIRPLAGSTDWAALVDISLRLNQGRHGYDRGFLEGRFAAFRRAIQGGGGAWWGAWDGERLIGHMGLFWDAGLVRFQNVETDPDYRRRGVCRSILYQACAAAQARLGAPRFVIVPVDASVRRIYEAVGFAFQERAVDFLREPPRCCP